MSESYNGGQAQDGQDDIQRAIDVIRRRGQAAQERKLDMAAIRRSKQPSQRIPDSRRSKSLVWSLTFKDAQGRQRKARPLENVLEALGPVYRRYGIPAALVEAIRVRPPRKRQRKVRPHMGMQVSQTGTPLLDAAQELDRLPEDISPALELYVLEDIVREAGWGKESLPVVQTPDRTPTWVYTPQSELPSQEHRQGLLFENAVSYPLPLMGKQKHHGSTPAASYGEGVNWTLEQEANRLLAESGFDPYETPKSKSA